VQSLAGSKMVEISPDQKHMRTRNDPNKWSLAGVEPTTFSSLDASVPEFVPGQVFRPAAVTPQSNAADTKQPQMSDKDPVTMDSASSEEVSSWLEEMSISVVTTAEAAVSEGASAVNEVDNIDADVQPDSTASFQDNEDAVAERLHIPPDDKEHGKQSE